MDAQNKLSELEQRLNLLMINTEESFVLVNVDFKSNLSIKN